MTRARASTLILAAAVLVGVGLLGFAVTRPLGTPTHQVVCQAADDLADTLDLTSWTDKAALRARAARLADLISARAEARTEARESAAELAVADRMIVVLSDPMATRAELEEVLRPVLVSCDRQPRSG